MEEDLKNYWLEQLKQEAELKERSVEYVQNIVQRLAGLGYPVWDESIQKCDLLGVRLWDPQFSGSNVTFFCHQLLSYFRYEGTIVIDTELSSISWRNIDYQSSGFVLMHIEHKQDDHYERSALFYFRPFPDRGGLFVPRGGEDWSNGFCWDMDKNEIKQLTYPHYQLPMDVISRYRPVNAYYTHEFNFILNFSVCGEFNLRAYFVPDKYDVYIPIFQRGFCCK